MTATDLDLCSLELWGLDRTPLPLAGLRGAPLVLLLGNRLTQQAGHRIVDALRTDPETRDLGILQVAHLKGVPRSLHGVVERDIAGGRQVQIERAARLRTEAGLDADDEPSAIAVALDWSGVLGGRVGFGARDTEPLTLLADADLTVHAELRGDEPLPGLRAALPVPTAKEIR